MIPKTIHYCWFGRGEKPELARRCIASWKKHCPDYRIVEWNEDNFDISQYPYLQWCYENGKWAFLSDFARLLIVQRQGGIYFDTDVELVRRPDELLKYDAFYGFENDSYINTGEGFGAVANHPTLTAMVHEYVTLKPNDCNEFPCVTCPQLNTKALLPYGLKRTGEKQIIAGAVILPVEYLNPYDDPTGQLRKTQNTYSIHWYSKSWMDKKTVLRSKLTKPFHRIFGTDCFGWLKK